MGRREGGKVVNMSQRMGGMEGGESKKLKVIIMKGKVGESEHKTKRSEKRRL